MSKWLTKIAENAGYELWIDPSDSVKRYRRINKGYDGFCPIEGAYGFYLTSKIYHPFTGDAVKSARKLAKRINSQWYHEVVLGEKQ